MQGSRMTTTIEPAVELPRDEPEAYIARDRRWALATHREMPDRASKIVSRIKDVRGGRLSDASFGSRMKGQGVTADSYRQLFHIQCEKYGLNKGRPGDHPIGHFRRPAGPQIEMFDEKPDHDQAG